MARLAPEGPVYQAGTLSGNPVAMAAGLESLNLMEQESGWSYLESLGQYLEEQLAPVLAAAPFPAQLVRLGSLFWMALQGGEAPRSAEAIESQAGERYGKIFQGLLQRGVALAPSAYEVGFLSLAHDRSHIDQFRDALQDTLADMK